MRKLILGFLGFIAVFAHIDQCAATEEKTHISEATFFVTSQDLYFDHDEIMVMIDEHFFPVQTLQKSGDQWKVQVVSSGYCQMGHNLCRGCHMCHMPRCIYYVRPCRLWN